VESALVPWGLAGLELGDDVLEIGPGLGATTRVLLTRVPGALTAAELDPGYCARLREAFAPRVEVVHADATSLPFGEGRFSAVVCFTMLHHVDRPGAQDDVFREVARVLRPGGVFAGTDSVGTGALFTLIHIGDTLRPIDPGGLPARLAAAGFTDVEVSRQDGSFRFRARTPTGH
jgi:ubiquinone/menaquinone biosynthesis C-methylase UbiE